MLKRTNEEGRQSLWRFPRPEITWIFAVEMLEIYMQPLYEYQIGQPICKEKNEYNSCFTEGSCGFTSVSGGRLKHHLWKQHISMAKHEFFF